MRTKSLRVNYPFSSINVVAGTTIWSLQLSSPTNSNWFELMGQVPGTCPTNYAKVVVVAYESFSLQSLTDKSNRFTMQVVTGAGRL